MLSPTSGGNKIVNYTNNFLKITKRKYIKFGRGLADDPPLYLRHMQHIVMHGGPCFP